MIRSVLALLGAFYFVVGSAFAYDQTTGSSQQQPMKTRDVVAAGHQFFGGVSGNIATAIEKVVSSRGRPNGYILGEEGAGAFIGGLRYGEGVLYTGDGQTRKIFWQGPSIGFDAGGDGNRTMMLIYGLPYGDAIHQRFVGVDGSAYLAGGLGVTVLHREPVTIVPIRSGVGARLGINVGYLKFTQAATWNPF